MDFSAQNVVASLGILVGGLGVILSLLIAFGVNITPDQHTSIEAVASLLMLVLGVFLHKNIPLGSTEEKPPA